MTHSTSSPKAAATDMFSDEIAVVPEAEATLGLLELGIEEISIEPVAGEALSVDCADSEGFRPVVGTDTGSNGRSVDGNESEATTDSDSIVLLNAPGPTGEGVIEVVDRGAFEGTEDGSVNEANKTLDVAFVDKDADAEVDGSWGRLAEADFLAPKPVFSQ
ncbi:MAG: hypothetical protein Q9187_001090 [Circinaria calcarea]